ncbi:MAG TPA: nickel-dependent lactate racemase [Desulfopila sp.]|nr:nickel-dependent lactate racemase [Desulfopila sp.]
MENVDFTLNIGKEAVTFSLLKEQVLYHLQGRNRKPPVDLKKAYLHALDHPIDCPPLKEIVNAGEKVAITVSDITRGWQRNNQTLPVLIDYLVAAGIKEEDITILIAVGAHRQNTQAELEEICTKEICQRVKVLNHDAWDSDNMVYYGKTSRDTEVSINAIVAEADRVILTGGVIYHYMVGYGGGRKSVMPGVASLKTIQQCHMWAMQKNVGEGSSPLAANMKTSGNPAHEDMMEAAAFIQPDFIVNVVPNLDGDITGIFTGNWVSAWLAATKMVDDIFGVPIREQADIVIASTGGYPKDINLYQSQKTIDNAVYAMKPGGVVILLAECPDIQEPREFFDWFDFPNPLAMEKAVRADFLISGWVAVRQIEYSSKGTIIMVTKEENVDIARKAGIQGVTSIEEALEMAYEKCGENMPKVTVMPQGANTFPILEP